MQSLIWCWRLKSVSGIYPAQKMADRHWMSTFTDLSDNKIFLLWFQSHQWWVIIESSASYIITFRELIQIQLDSNVLPGDLQSLEYQLFSRQFEFILQRMCAFRRTLLKIETLAKNWDPCPKLRPLPKIETLGQNWKRNAGVLRQAQWGQKPHVEQKGKSLLDFDFQYEYRPRKRGLSILLILGVLSKRCQKSYHRDNWLVAAKRS